MRHDHRIAISSPCLFPRRDTFVSLFLPAASRSRRRVARKTVRTATNAHRRGNRLHSRLPPRPSRAHRRSSRSRRSARPARSSKRPEVRGSVRRGSAASARTPRGWRCWDPSRERARRSSCRFADHARAAHRPALISNDVTRGVLLASSACETARVENARRGALRRRAALLYGPTRWSFAVPRQGSVAEWTSIDPSPTKSHHDS
jgi:hypothetical protein